MGEGWHPLTTILLFLHTGLKLYLTLSIAIGIFSFFLLDNKTSAGRHWVYLTKLHTYTIHTLTSTTWLTYNCHSAFPLVSFFFFFFFSFPFLPLSFVVQRTKKKEKKGKKLWGWRKKGSTQQHRANYFFATNREMVEAPK